MPKKQTHRLKQRVVRLSESEDQTIREKALEAGYSTHASFLRELALGVKIKTSGKLDREFQKQIWRQVSGIGRNLNQIAFKLNSNAGIYQTEFEAVYEEIKALRTDLKNIGLEKPE